MLPNYKLTDYPVPREMTKEDIKVLKEEFVQAARNALRAGCVVLRTNWTLYASLHTPCAH